MRQPNNQLTRFNVTVPGDVQSKVRYYRNIRFWKGNKTESEQPGKYNWYRTPWQIQLVSLEEEEGQLIEIYTMHGKVVCSHLQVTRSSKGNRKQVALRRPKDICVPADGLAQQHGQTAQIWYAGLQPPYSRKKGSHRWRSEMNSNSTLITLWSEPLEHAQKHFAHTWEVSSATRKGASMRMSNEKNL